jgi:hypothetical protein
MKKNLSKLMKLLSLLVVLVIVAPTMIKAQAGKTNFAGSWTLNESKSTLSQTGGGMRMGGSFTATQEANLLTRSRTGQDGTVRVSKYFLDGKESTNPMFQGNESKSTTKWSADGKTLTIVTKMNFDGNEMTATEVWSLIDAKTLSIVSTRPNQDGETVKNTLVYDKK